MATGACGINCDICRLNLLGICTTCGPGNSAEAKVKLAAQKRLLNETCAILSCAALNHKDYCLRDCSQFPCHNFSNLSYPFSASFLNMQKRSRKDPVPRMDPLGRPIEIPDQHWLDLEKRELNLVCSVSLAKSQNKGNLVFDFLNKILVLDIPGRQIRLRQKNKEMVLDNPLLTLTVLCYFKAVDRLYPIGKEMISTKDMKGAVYFKGDHALRIQPVLNRFAGNPGSFCSAIKALGGNILKDTADHAGVVYPFPRVPVYYLFWDLKGSHDPRLSILFDRSLESLMQPPIIWGLVNLVNAYLICV